MRLFGVGHDHGNSQTSVCLYAGMEPQMLTFPSASADGSLHQLAKARRAEGDDTMVVDYQALREGEYVLLYEGSERFIGDLALTQGQGASTGRGDINRYWSRRSLETLLVATAALVPDTEYELLVVTGLPVETFDEQTRKNVKAALNGWHQFTFNGRRRRVYIKVGKVLMEGAGAALLHGIDIDADEDIIGFADIGGYSTDLYARQGLQAIARLCRGKALGVENAAEKVSRWFEEAYGYALEAKERTAILKAYVTPATAYPHLHTGGHLIAEGELEAWAKKALDETGKQIAEFVSQTWRNGETGKVAANFKSVELIGGGAYYFRDALKKLIPFAEVMDQPEYANARGYGWYAHQLVQQRVSSLAS